MIMQAAPKDAVFFNINSQCYQYVLTNDQRTRLKDCWNSKINKSQVANMKKESIDNYIPDKTDSMASGAKPASARLPVTV